MEKLEKIRLEINKIDKEMIKLFEKRMKIVEEVIDFKIKNNMKILDENREKQVIERNLNLIENKELERYYLDFIVKVMEISRTYQKEILDKK